MATVLFECAIILNELRDAAGNIAQEGKIIREPFYLVATNQNQATLLAGKELPDEIAGDPQLFDRAVVIVRPF